MIQHEFLAVQRPLAGIGAPNVFGHRVDVSWVRQDVSHLLEGRGLEFRRDDAFVSIGGHVQRGELRVETRGVLLVVVQRRQKRVVGVGAELFFGTVCRGKSVGRKQGKRGRRKHGRRTLSQDGRDAVVAFQVDHRRVFQKVSK